MDLPDQECILNTSGPANSSSLLTEGWLFTPGQTPNLNWASLVKANVSTENDDDDKLI